MRNIFTVIVLLLAVNSSFALTSDTIHVKHYTINMDSVNMTAKTLSGNTIVTVESRLDGVNNITLSLLELTIDSIYTGSQNLVYTYDDTLIRITPPVVLNQGDSVVLTIAYHGSPQHEGFGGFFFNGGQAFNIGMGLKTDPHPFSRSWFPCMDEFGERALYDFHVVTDSSEKAFCNGNLDSVSYNGNGKATWHWHMDKPICTYMVGFAVAPFYTIHRTWQGVPVQIACLPADTANTLSTLENIDTCLMHFINLYGPYPWNKLGIVSVPFTGGGMEHASSMHIGNVFLDGTLAYQSLTVHELAHMWWGDKVTVANEQEVWLKEGNAVANEHLFVKLFYGDQNYKNTIRTNHHSVLQFSHALDSGYYALNALPHQFTFGKTAYFKGADIVRTLRGYMGDSAFFRGCRGYMNNLAYGKATSTDFRDQMAAASGMNLDAFFTDWVFTPGFPHFSVDSFITTPNGGQYDVAVYTKQKQKGNTHIYTEPVECTFSDGVNDTTVVMHIDAATNVFNYTLGFSPGRTIVDKDDKIADATVADEVSLSSVGSGSFAETGVNYTVKNAGTGTSVVRVEHSFVAPDNFKHNPGIQVSDYHYYRVDGLFKPGLVISSNFYYNGTNSPSAGYLDNTLITGTEDSLVLLYRTGTADDWHIVNSYTLTTGANHMDKQGFFKVDTLKPGEYCYGYRNHLLGLPEATQQPTCSLKAFPNPTSEDCTLSFELPYAKNGRIEIVNVLGQVVYSTQIFSHQQFIKWDTFGVKPGLYIASIYVGNRKMDVVNIVVAH